MQVSTNQGVKLNGFYRGKVVKHCDHGYCKVYIPGVYPAEYEEFEKCDALPDCEQASPLFSGCNKGNGVFSYPNIGAIVVCGFWNGDQNYPFYFASTLGGELGADEFSKCISSEDEEEQKSGDDSRIHRIVTDQSEIEIYESGHIHVVTYGTKSGIFGGQYVDLDIDGEGDVIIKGTQSLTIDFPQINITANDITINTDTLTTNSSVQIDEITPQKNTMCTNSITQISPAINLDASSGMIKLTGKREVKQVI